ncbi:MAG TPA: 30S ribosomal protein S8e [Candidatus Nanoarchaeia archaeon]|nr:30S ribosomal protein S8e [Candidatus Nanoarchaeia archaeon]
MKTGRKITGGKYKKPHKKKLQERPGEKKTIYLGEEKRKSKRSMGGSKKTFLLKGKYISIPTSSGKKHKKLEIKNVVETPSNRFLARQNILTKGTIVETPEGNAKITNRPTQEGTINGVFVKE